MKAVESMYGSLDHFKIITVAPEIEGALDTIKELTDCGKIVSMGKCNIELSISKVQLVCYVYNVETCLLWKKLVVPATY